MYPLVICIIRVICCFQDSVEVVVFDGDPEKTTAIVMNYFRSRSYSLAWAQFRECGEREGKYKREGMCPNFCQAEHEHDWATNRGRGGSSKGAILHFHLKSNLPQFICRLSGGQMIPQIF